MVKRTTTLNLPRSRADAEQGAVAVFESPQVGGEEHAVGVEIRELGKSSFWSGAPWSLVSRPASSFHVLACSLELYGPRRGVRSGARVPASAVFARRLRSSRRTAGNVVRRLLAGAVGAVDAEAGRGRCGRRSVRRTRSRRVFWRTSGWVSPRWSGAEDTLSHPGLGGVLRGGGGDRLAAQPRPVVVVEVVAEKVITRPPRGAR